MSSPGRGGWIRGTSILRRLSRGKPRASRFGRCCKICSGIRFHLKTHTEVRKMASYALVVAKKGPKAWPRSTTTDPAFVFGADHFDARGFSLQGLADRLSEPVFRLERPVVDMTGIQGSYDFTLNWSADGIAPEGRAGASIFTALEEQLGLKLVARKLALRVLVVEHIDRDPSSN